MQGGLIALFELQPARGKVSVVSEKHYHLVPAKELSPEELAAYRTREESSAPD